MSVLVLALVLPQSSFAIDPVAQVASVKGKVLLNSGDGFSNVAPQTPVNVGDQILVSQNSAVTLNYPAADCSSSFNDPAVVAVGSSAPCDTKAGSKKLGGGSGTATSGSQPVAAASIPNLRSSSSGSSGGGGGGSTPAKPVVTPVSLP